MIENLSDTSRVWVFGADRFLTSDEKDFITSNVELFLKGWATHGKDLYGFHEILHDNFIVIAVDEAKVPASGCSIDTLTQFMKKLGSELKVDFFNRLNVLIYKESEYKRVPFSEINHFPEWKLFNPMIATVKEFKHNWIVGTDYFSN